jgi:hypothetical protein
MSEETTGKGIVLFEEKYVRRVWDEATDGKKYNTDASDAEGSGKDDRRTGGFACRGQPAESGGDNSEGLVKEKPHPIKGAVCFW